MHAEFNYGKKKSNLNFFVFENVEKLKKKNLYVSSEVVILKPSL